MKSDSKMKEKRQQLCILSADARAIKEKMINEFSEQGDEVKVLQWIGRTLNSIIVEYFYQTDQARIFNTYNQWKSEGMQVRKGEKAVIVWGEKRHTTKQQTETTPEENYEFWPICHLFSNLQVDKIQNDDSIEKAA